MVIFRILDFYRLSDLECHAHPQHSDERYSTNGPLVFTLYNDFRHSTDLFRTLNYSYAACYEYSFTFYVKMQLWLYLNVRVIQLIYIKTGRIKRQISC